MLDFNDMVFFAEVVDKGGFAAAGRSLTIPKSRLSRRIAELETRLGVRLLQRTTRKLSLTAVGEQVYRHCIAIREQAQAVEDTVAQAHTEPCGMIRVACPITLAQTTISPVVTELDWNRLVMIKPIIIAIRISSVMASNERTSGSS